MSTNYYAVTPDTGLGDDGLHIGQSAVGWEFLWQAGEGVDFRDEHDCPFSYADFC